MKYFHHNGVDYIRIDLVDSNSVFLDSQLKDIKTKLLSNGECLQNALITARMSNSQSVEGFVYCMVAKDEYVIRHCWNFINGVHFDVTKDFEFDKVTNKPKEFIYFIVKKFNYEDYFKSITDQRVNFLSIAPRIAEEINALLKQV